MSDDLDLSGMSDREILLYLAKSMPPRLSDHSRRIRALENWRNWLAGGGTVIGAALAMAKLKIRLLQE